MFSQNLPRELVNLNLPANGEAAGSLQSKFQAANPGKKASNRHFSHNYWNITAVVGDAFSNYDFN